LGFRKINIVLVPEGANKVRQFRIPRFLLAFVLVLLVSGGAFVGWILQDYQAVKAKLPRLVRLEKEYGQQKKQAIHLAKRIDRLQKRMCELNELDQKLKVMVNLEPEEDQRQFQGVGGSEPVLLASKDTVVENHEQLVRLMHRSLDNLEEDIALGKEDKAELYEFLKNQKMLLASTPSIWPTRGWISSGFGDRTSPFTGEKEFHRGIDIATRKGAPIIAPADGIVSSVVWDHGYGKVLTVKHGYGLVTKYAHLKKSLVKKGQRVKRGETIAMVGNSGRSTGPHLHYEVHLNRVAVNPLRYILN